MNTLSTSPQELETRFNALVRDIQPYDEWAKSHFWTALEITEADYKAAMKRQVHFKVYGERPTEVGYADRLVWGDSITDPNAPWYAMHFANIGIGSIPIPRNPTTQKIAAAALGLATIACATWKEFSTSVERPALEPAPVSQKIDAK